MLKRFALLLILIFALEIWLLIEVGQLIGGWLTFVLIIVTGCIGLYLSKIEVRKLLFEAKREFAAGHLPGRSIIDGCCLFVGGMLLIFPGFITDVAGFLLLLPPTRALLRGWILIMLKKWLDSGIFRYYRR